MWSQLRRSSLVGRVAATRCRRTGHPRVHGVHVHDPAGAGRPGIFYGLASGATAYAQPGGLVVAGRDNYQDRAFKDSRLRGSVLIYLDAIVDNAHGRYHEMLFNASSCGPATSRWPGNYQASQGGNLTDFRVGSVLQSKFRCVLETMVAENPHMAGWFADDLGSRSWFPGIDWAAFPDKAAYRAGPSRSPRRCARLPTSTG